MVNQLRKYKEDFMKIKLDSYDDGLPLGKILSFFCLNIVVKSAFQFEDGFFPKMHSINVNISVNINCKEYT